MKSISDVIRAALFIFISVVFIAVIIFEFYASAEICEVIGNCKISAKSANAENKIRVEGKRRMSGLDIHDDKFTILCGCIKFSECKTVGECRVFKNDNRILIASERYSAPVYYFYDCNPQNRQYSDEKCIDEIKKISVRCIPAEVTGGSTPKIVSYSTDGGIFNAVLSLKDNSTFKISLRNDTLRPVFFDARDIYFK